MVCTLESREVNQTRDLSLSLTQGVPLVGGAMRWDMSGETVLLRVGIVVPVVVHNSFPMSPALSVETVVTMPPLVK